MNATDIKAVVSCELDKCTNLSIVGTNLPLPTGIRYHSNLNDVNDYVLTDALSVDRSILFTSKILPILKEFGITKQRTQRPPTDVYETKSDTYMLDYARFMPIRDVCITHGYHILHGWTTAMKEATDWSSTTGNAAVLGVTYVNQQRPFCRYTVLYAVFRTPDGACGAVRFATI